MRTSGIDRQPSSWTRGSPPSDTISGLIITIGLRLSSLSETSSTSSRRGTPTCTRGEADAGRGVHGLQHVVDQAPQVVIDALDGADGWRRIGSGSVTIGSLAMRLR